MSAEDPSLIGMAQTAGAQSLVAGGATPLSQRGLLWRRGAVTLRRCRRGLIAFLHRDFLTGACLEAYGEVSENDFSVLRHLLRPGDVVVDAGAHLGVHSLFFSQRVGVGGRVYSFEPQARIFQLLTTNMTLNERHNVRLWLSCLGRAAGRVEMPKVDYKAVSNFGGVSFAACKTGGTVPVITLDSLRLPRLDLLKADVEGMEVEVLAGADETIRRCRPYLWLESDRVEVRSALRARILELGYRPVRIRLKGVRERNFYRQGRDIFLDRFGRAVFTSEFLAVPRERPLPEVLRHLPPGATAEVEA